MRIVYFANNLLAARLAEWLTSQGESIVAAVLHPEHRRKCSAELIAALPAGVPIIDGSKLSAPESIEQLRGLRPDIGVSVLFGYILRKDVLGLFPAGCVNLHPALLPYNRGAYPNVWSIIEETPAGATLHYIDEGVDTGNIIAQREVPVEPVDTGASLYSRLESAALLLFQETWPKIRSGESNPVSQSATSGTVHKVRDVTNIDCIDLDATYKAKDLINLIRARTFPPYRGAYFVHNGKKIYLELKLDCESETGGKGNV